MTVIFVLTVALLVAIGSLAAVHIAIRRGRAGRRRALAAQNSFATALAHEFRTPLSALVGYTELLETGILGDLRPRQREAVARMRESQQHIVRLTEDLLDVGRLDAGVLPIARGHFGIDEVTERAITLVGPQARKKGIRVVTRRSPTPVICVADRDRVCQIIVTLLANAVKFTPERGLIRLGAGTTGDYAWLRVWDTGVGIAPEYHARIFDPYERADATGVVHGAGLGLAISRRLAIAMGGDLSVASQPGAGACFTLRLPLHRADSVAVRNADVDAALVT